MSAGGVQHQSVGRQIFILMQDNDSSLALFPEEFVPARPGAAPALADLSVRIAASFDTARRDVTG
jgi:hypothetical protein